MEVATHYKNRITKHTGWIHRHLHLVVPCIIILIGFIIYVWPNHPNAVPKPKPTASLKKIAIHKKALPVNQPPSIHKLLSGKNHLVIATIRSGDTLSHIFHKLHINKKIQQEIQILPQFINFANALVPKEKLVFLFNDHWQLLRMHYPAKKSGFLLIYKRQGHYHSEIINSHSVTKPVLIESNVHGSFYRSAKKAGLDAKAVMALTHLFHGQVHFNKMPSGKSSFRILYDETYKHHHPINSGVILAAQIRVNHDIHTAIRMPNGNHSVSYYNLDGKNLEKAYKRYPLHFRYISSLFSLHRYHPILHIYRPHYGIDLAAPAGTAVHATSNGKITYLGWMHGYGRVIILRYDYKYSSRYAHLEKFAKHLKVGSYVKKNQLIGYVGMSGLATGPHLHYEFRVYGHPVNPLHVKLPQGHPIASWQKNRFEAYTKIVLSEINRRSLTRKKKNHNHK